MNKQSSVSSFQQFINSFCTFKVNKVYIFKFLNLIALIFLCSIQTITPFQYRHSINYRLPILNVQTMSTTSSSKFDSIYVMSPADLTPAIDKYAKFPLPDSKENFLLTAKGPTPVGPEPFGLVSDDLQPLSDYVKELVVSENPVLTMAASHFFEQVS